LTIEPSGQEYNPGNFVSRERSMKSLLALAFAISISFLPAPAQTGSGGGGGRSTNTPTRPRIPSPDLTPNTMVFLSGKVVVDDGSVLTESASIQTVCKGQKRTETHTDSNGSFSFQFGGRSPAGTGFDDDASSRITTPGRPDRQDLKDCQLQASLPGFTSDAVELAGRFSGNDNADIGRIVLHRQNTVEGFTISATTAQAPGSARKALEKGQQQQKQGKWGDAQKSLEEAVAIYPKFAAAWFELGRVELQRNDSPGARHSFQQSIAADSKYLNPYLGLTQLAQREQNWQELAEVSDKLLALNPVSFPDVWFSNSLANYFLQSFATAEKSARRGLQLDTEHRVPRLEYLLGMVLLKKPDYQDAAQHLRAFLSLATKPAEVGETQKQLDEIDHLSAAANLAASQGK
jgi:tetratricopeptide (TPR) repeat protein